MDRDKKLGKPSSSSSLDSDNALPAIGPHNPALGEIYQRLYPEMRRPKPNQEAIAAALQAMQRLTMESDSEAVAENAAPRASATPSNACRVCGHHNREGNKFCGMCGLPIGTEPSNSPDPAMPLSALDYDDEILPQAPRPATEHVHSGTKDEVHPPARRPAGHASLPPSLPSPLFPGRT